VPGFGALGVPGFGIRTVAGFGALGVPGFGIRTVAGFGALGVAGLGVLTVDGLTAATAAPSGVTILLIPQPVSTIVAVRAAMPIVRVFPIQSPRI
jgi:hypothetical protein